ncbi:hypothetical protein RI844_04920 [Thalassotalea fonticola]|uniref:DUF3718 domain-containing protein n=1 Tax=Thalassotalea fonticola TaxID=3065649 RepID=A0ABZ0GRZ6_9GAMM|nr:hypothetical protein RI844_04920 [Colwelliaceae bacterium S1-1]
MKWITVLSIIMFNLPYAEASDCPIEENAEQMYSVFFQVAYEPNKEEAGTFKTKLPDEDKAKIAWSCLIKSAKLKNCSAIRLLELHYEHGIGKITFGIPADKDKANFYKQQRVKLCSE